MKAAKCISWARCGVPGLGPVECGAEVRHWTAAFVGRSCLRVDCGSGQAVRFVPLHAEVALGVRGGITPTLS
jgi:hypothetical protein